MSNSFTQCIADICGLEMSTLAGSYKYAVFGGHTAVVEGHKGISSFGSERITFALRGAELQVCGKELHIRRLDGNFAVIVGKIDSVGVIGNE